MTDSELVVAAEYKVLVIGEFCTGKTSIVSRFIDNEFTFQTMTTIGIDFQSKVVTVDGVRVRLKVWDTAGQEKFRTITRMHFRGAQGIVLVYDITKRDSFENLQYWVERIQEERLRGESLVLLGNKSDLSSEREVSEEYAQSFSRELGIKQFQTSAKDNINITEVHFQQNSFLYHCVSGHGTVLLICSKILRSARWVCGHAFRGAQHVTM
eukprot:m.19602 g.19602  ORF g.19602 m.19602 type:complete len:210 (+) comp27867_c0_seq4:47-676(+)